MGRLPEQPYREIVRVEVVLAARACAHMRLRVCVYLCWCAGLLVCARVRVCTCREEGPAEHVWCFPVLVAVEAHLARVRPVEPRNDLPSARLDVLVQEIIVGQLEHQLARRRRAARACVLDSELVDDVGVAAPLANDAVSEARNTGAGGDGSCPLQD